MYVDGYKGTGGAGIPNESADIVLKINPTKNTAFAVRFVRMVRDPQTYALLYCSVFKERTLLPSFVRAGSSDRSGDVGTSGTRVRLPNLCK